MPLDGLVAAGLNPYSTRPQAIDEEAFVAATEFGAEASRSLRLAGGTRSWRTWRQPWSARSASVDKLGHDNRGQRRAAGMVVELDTQRVGFEPDGVDEDVGVQQALERHEKGRSWSSGWSSSAGKLVSVPGSANHGETRMTKGSLARVDCHARSKGAP